MSARLGWGHGWVMGEQPLAELPSYHNRYLSTSSPTKTANKSSPLSSANPAIRMSGWRLKPGSAKGPDFEPGDSPEQLRRLQEVAEPRHAGESRPGLTGSSNCFDHEGSKLQSQSVFSRCPRSHGVFTAFAFPGPPSIR